MYSYSFLCQWSIMVLEGALDRYKAKKGYACVAYMCVFFWDNIARDCICAASMAFLKKDI